MTATRLVSTYSIVARDPAGDAVGVAVQSRSFAAGRVVPWAEAGVGAVATQASADPGYGPRALALLRQGASAKDALARLVAADPQAAVRQVAVLDAQGGLAVHTGQGCIPFAGHCVGDGYATLGNLLARDGVCDAMARGFERARGDLAARLLAALDAGERAGGDARGREAAGLLVVRRVSEDEPWRNRVVDLRVDDHRQPIRELRRLLAIDAAFRRLDEAAQALAAGRLDEARVLGDEALRRAAGRHEEVALWVGVLRARLGDEPQALAALRAALRRNPRWRRVLPRLPENLRLPETLLRRVLRRSELRAARPRA